MAVKCANFNNIEARRKTVAEHEAMWGDPRDPFPYEINDNLICMECEFGIEETALILQALKAVSGDIGAKVAMEIKRMTGEPIQRVCFKERK